MTCQKAHTRTLYIQCILCIPCIHSYIDQPIILYMYQSIMLISRNDNIDAVEMTSHTQLRSWLQSWWSLTNNSQVFKLSQRPYIIETMHSYTLPMYCLSGLRLSLLTGVTQSVAIANTLGWLARPLVAEISCALIVHYRFSAECIVSLI